MARREGLHILVVDDEPAIRQVVHDRLSQEGYRVSAVASAEEALALLERERPDLAIVDLMLPGLDGFTLCERIRERSDLPILVLTARSEEFDKVVGFRLGVDDYVTKPFSPSELALRVQAILRRTCPGREEPERLLRSGPLTVDPARRLVLLDGKVVELSAREFDLLYVLASHPGYVLTREQLLDLVWGSDLAADGNNVTVAISRLREKLSSVRPGFDCIQTVRGVGYRFRVDVEAAAPGLGEAPGAP
ncbi:MAG: response regulator transcription factor [Firmicutes bacterium]|nr:response regulator transcription factor [Bacillota bacterium]